MTFVPSTRQDEASEATTRLDLARALATLPPLDQRIVALLAVVYTRRQIAAMLRQRMTAIDARMVVIRKHLAAAMAESEELSADDISICPATPVRPDRDPAR